MPRPADIAANLDAIRRRLAAAADRSHRSPASIRLVAVSKTVPVDLIRAAAAAGHRDFGENRVQEALPKIEALSDLRLEWHLIGHLQTNKARKVAPAFGWIESVDSLELLRKLDGAAAESGVRPVVLIQVDLAGETTKHGARREAVAGLARAALASPALDLQGLMIVPPAPEAPEDSRPWFRQLRELRDELVAGGLPADRLGQLSMGMSGDFEVAVEEGATIVRIGSALFGAR